MKIPDILNFALNSKTSASPLRANGVLLVNWNVKNKMQQELDKVYKKYLEFNANL